jgi:cell division protein FtsW (lipid II flippase)
MKSSTIYQPQFGVVALCCIILIIVRLCTSYLRQNKSLKDNAVYNRYGPLGIGFEILFQGCNL